jgi:T-complex protein 1 subunit theta
VYGCAIDTSATETKGTVLIRNAAELEGYAVGEEARVEAAIKAIADTGAKVVVTGQTIGEMALHFIEKYGLMALKIPSKFELRRFCRTTNAVALIKLDPPSADELGFAASCSIDEIGGTRCCIIRQADASSAVATVVLRGATENVMDDIERAVDDGVNAYKALARDGRLVAAGGAAEIAIAARLAAAARAETGLEQYAIAKFATSLEVVARTLAENAGLNATDVLSALYAAHAAGSPRAGVDIENGGVRDLGQDGLFDLYATKAWAIRLAADAVTTVLRVDQIIMSKQAGGPSGGGPGGGDD